MKCNFIIFLLVLSTTASFAQSVSEVYFPQYIQGAGTFNAADDRKVPFVARLTVIGLTPHATYRYFNRFVSTPSSTTVGEGAYILVKDTGNFIRVTSATLALPGRYGEFTTDSTGSYTGWFAAEAASSGIFTPGNNVYLRLVLNNGSNGITVTHRLTAPNPVKVINFNTTNDSTSGTALRTTPLRHGSPKQFVFLYDNLLGFGRPITGTFIESDGSDNSIANGYAPFYADSVNGINKTWGTIIPNGLSRGILHIAQRSLGNAALDRLYLSFDGKWPSINRTTANTRNATGGLDNVLVIDGGKLAIINLWLNGEATSEDLVTLQWSTPDEPNAHEYVVEKSIDGGKTFTVFARIKATGDKPFYELTDLRNGTAAFYRVNVAGKDQSKAASDVLAVEGVLKINMYPNPVRNEFLIQHPQAAAGSTLQVIGIDGRQFFTQTVQPGAVQTTVNASRLIPGSYMVIFNMNGQRQSRSFIKK